MNPQVVDFAIIHQIYPHHGFPWVFSHTHCHQMITQQRPKGPEGLSEVTHESRFLSQPMPA